MGKQHRQESVGLDAGSGQHVVTVPVSAAAYAQDTLGNQAVLEQLKQLSAARTPLHPGMATRVEADVGVLKDCLRRLRRRLEDPGAPAQPLPALPPILEREFPAYPGAPVDPDQFMEDWTHFDEQGDSQYQRDYDQRSPISKYEGNLVGMDVGIDNCEPIMALADLICGTMVLAKQTTFTSMSVDDGINDWWNLGLLDTNFTCTITAHLDGAPELISDGESTVTTTAQAASTDTFGETETSRWGLPAVPLEGLGTGSLGLDLGTSESRAAGSSGGATSTLSGVPSSLVRRRLVLHVELTGHGWTGSATVDEWVDVGTVVVSEFGGSS